MFRLIFFFFIFYLFLKLSRFLRQVSQARSQAAPNPTPTPQRPQPGIIDEMKACAYCETYSPASLGVQKKGLYFCQQECQEKFFQENRGL